MGRIGGRWLMPISRRINTPDGAFGGVVSIGVDPHYFSNFYRDIDLGKEAVVTLAGNDGFVRSRMSGKEADSGQDLSNTHIVNAVKQGRQGSLTFQSKFDGINRIWSYRALRDYPLWVTVATSEREALAHFHRQQRNSFIATGMATLLILAFCFWLLRMDYREQIAHAELEIANRSSRESEIRYRTLVEWSPEPILVHRHGNIVYANPAAIKLFGALSMQDLTDKPVLELIHPDFHQSWRERLRRIVEFSDDQPMMERRLLRLDGTTIVAETKGTSIVYEGTPAVHLAIRDITDRVQHEQELQRLNAELEQRVEQRTNELKVANSELEAFSYSVSHDLRAPLRAIHGFSTLVETQYADKIDEQGRGMLRRVAAGVQKMGLLIDDLLRLSRISRQSMRVQPTDLSGLAWEVAGDLQIGAPERKVEWVITPGVSVTGDPGLLRVMLQNLIGNAWKYSSKCESARIELGIGEWQGKVVLFVRDNGAGFDMAYADKLFAAFQRLHSPKEFPGNGIGLATVKRIIHRHGGKVWAESKLGEGATFYFTL
jgi:PAS domain S-box-containing protein